MACMPRSGVASPVVSWASIPTQRPSRRQADCGKIGVMAARGKVARTAIPEGIDVRLRAVGRRDRRFHARLYGDADLMRLIGPSLSAPAARRAAHAAALRRGAQCSDIRDWVILATQQRHRVGLAGWRRQGEALELGVMLLPSWQRRGIAVIALRQLLHLAGRSTNVRTLLIRHHPANAAM